MFVYSRGGSSANGDWCSCRAERDKNGGPGAEPPEDFLGHALFLVGNALFSMGTALLGQRQLPF